MQLFLRKWPDCTRSHMVCVTPQSKWAPSSCQARVNPKTVGIITVKNTFQTEKHDCATNEVSGYWSIATGFNFSRIASDPKPRLFSLLTLSSSVNFSIAHSHHATSGTDWWAGTVMMEQPCLKNRMAVIWHGGATSKVKDPWIPTRN